QGLDFHSKRRRGSSCLFEYERGVRIGGVPENGHSLDPRQKLLEQLETLSAEIGRHQAEAGYVATRPRQAFDEAAAYWVAARPHDDWDGLCGLLCGQWCESSISPNHIHVEADELCGELAESLGPIFAI